MPLRTAQALLVCKIHRPDQVFLRDPGRVSQFVTQQSDQSGSLVVIVQQFQHTIFHLRIHKSKSFPVKFSSGLR